MISYERETEEFQPIFIAIGGSSPDWAKVTVSIAPLNERPTEWTPVAMVDSIPGFWVKELAPGMYEVYVRIGHGYEVIVRNLGYITIS